MKLDQTFIAIRERRFMESCDLALHVVRIHFRPLLILLIIGALPWVIIDWLLINWMMTEMYSYDFGSVYYFILALLVISQAHLGTAFVTYYLGQAMFVGRISIGEAIKGTFKTSLYFLWSHGVLRLAFPVLGLAFLIKDADDDMLPIIIGLFFPALVICGSVIRGVRPFASEMLLLERTPIFSKDPLKVSFKRRSNALHGANSADLFGRFMTISIFLIPLTFTFFSLFVKIDTTLNLQANSDISLFAYYWIAALWLAAGFASVVRFLSYIDMRIRQEGWAVELKMRAEGQRLAPVTD
jgi:hypothetical protein